MSLRTNRISKKVGAIAYPPNTRLAWPVADLFSSHEPSGSDRKTAALATQGQGMVRGPELRDHRRGLVRRLGTCFPFLSLCPLCVLLFTCAAGS